METVEYPTSNPQLPSKPILPPKKPFLFMPVVIIALCIGLFTITGGILWIQNTPPPSYSSVTPQQHPTPTNIPDTRQPTAPSDTQRMKFTEKMITPDMNSGFIAYTIQAPEGWKQIEHSSAIQNLETFKNESNTAELRIYQEPFDGTPLSDINTPLIQNETSNAIKMPIEVNGQQRFIVSRTDPNYTVFSTDFLSLNSRYRIIITIEALTTVVSQNDFSNIIASFKELSYSEPASNTQLFIHITECCPCPVEKPKNASTSKEWMNYVPGVNYNQYLPKECRTAICDACPPLSRASQ